MNIKEYLIKRSYHTQEKTAIITLDGQEDFTIKYRNLSIAEFGDMKLDCTKATPIGDQVDEMKLFCKVVVACCKDPDFNTFDSTEQIKTPMQFVSTYFSPVEIRAIAAIIMSGSGITDNQQTKEINEIKNL